MSGFAAVTAAVLALLPLPVAAMSVTQRIAVPDGGWDYASFDSAGNRLMVARTDGVMTIAAATGTVTPQLVAARRPHQFDERRRDAVRRCHRQGHRRPQDRVEARRRGL
jgi:hypothetical protein